MPDQQKQPVIVVLTSHWITMAGVTLVTLAGFSWLFSLPENIRGNVGNPYIGLLVFIAIPVVFFAGLALIPIGIALGRRRAARGARHGPRPPGRLAARRHIFRDHDRGESCHRKPIDVSGRGAYGDHSVLRAELPCHEARIYGPPSPAASGGRLRLLPRRARRHGLAAKRKCPEPASLSRCIFNSYPRPIESALGEQPAGLFRRYLRAMPCP